MAEARPLSGKLAIVTGSAKGIGASIIENFAKKGANVVINFNSDSSAPVASELATSISNIHLVKAIAVQANVSTAEGCAALISKAKEAFAQTSPLQIDILVNNAARLSIGPLESIKPEEYRNSYDTNVLGPILLLQACVTYLPTDRSGRIVNISSTASSWSLAHQTVYAGSKAALEAMTRVWSRELAERATVNAVNPGPVLSGMYFAAPDEAKKAVAYFNPITPLSGVREDEPDEEIRQLGKEYGGRPAKPEEVAGVVGMLCSAESGWCTGSVVCANGGYRFSY